MFLTRVLAVCLWFAAVVGANCDFYALFNSLRHNEITLAEYTFKYALCVNGHNSRHIGYQPSCLAAPAVTQAVVKFRTSGSYVDGENEIFFKINGVISLVQHDEKFTYIQGFIDGARAFVSDGVVMSIHVHEMGEIDDGCVATRSHFNPCGKSHSDIPLVQERHVGDIGQFKINKEGDITKFEFTDPQVKLRGPLSVLGRSITLHAGKTSERVACGTIAATKWEDEGPHPEVAAIYY